MDTTIPISCIAVLPSSRLCGESDLTITNVSVFVIVRGLSPIVTSNGISPNGYDASPEKPPRGVLESTRRDLIDGFNFRKQCLMSLHLGWGIRNFSRPIVARRSLLQPVVSSAYHKDRGPCSSEGTFEGLGYSFCGENFS
ncbi:hypothetical protein Tco_0970722 [Tanacetum coccineum]